MNPEFPLNISNPKNAPLYQAGKWLEIQLLIDVEEMNDLIQSISPIFLFKVGKIVGSDFGAVSIRDFIDSYEKYLHCLQNGKPPHEESFTLAFTKNTHDLYALQTEKDKYVIKIARPVIQMQPHRIRYSLTDRKFHSMALGTDTMMWGIQISFPQLFQNPSTGEIEKTLQHEAHPNGLCFRNLQKWVRVHTCTTRFKAGGEILTTSIRLGKQCFSWINQHSQLNSANISVVHE